MMHASLSHARTYFCVWLRSTSLHNGTPPKQIWFVHEVLPPLFYWQTVPTSCRHSEHLQLSALIVLEQGRSYNRCVAELHIPARTPGVDMALC